MSAASWREILGVDPDPPGHKGHKGQNPGASGGSVRSVLSVPRVPPAKADPGPDAPELRHRFEERAAALEYEGGLPRAEAELRAWLDVALDWLEADPARAALSNRDARALAARALAAAGIPNPAAVPLRVAGGRRRA